MKYVIGFCGTILTCFACAIGIAYAHEGHAPLPTKGVEVNVQEGTILLTKDSRDSLGLQTAEVKTTSAATHVLAYARLVAPWQHSAVVASQIPGRIARIHVQPGEWLFVGQPLAEIESSELEKLQYDLIQAQWATKLSEQMLAHYRDLSGDVVAGAQLQYAVATHAENQNRLGVARLKLVGLGFSTEQLDALTATESSRLLSNLTLTSPISGRVHHNDLTIGKVIVPGEHLFEVDNLSSVWCRIEMLEHDFHRVQPLQEAIIRLNALPDREIRTRVHTIEPAIDALTQLGTAWADLVNDSPESPELIPGMFGQAQLRSIDTEQRLTVPAAAVARDGAERFVLVQQESTAKASQFIKRNIHVTGHKNEWVQFQASDVFPGDLVVTTGVQQLFNFFVQSVLKLSPEARANIALRVEPTELRSIEQVVSAAGRVELPAEQRDVASIQLTGILDQILVERGQSVRAGDVVAEIASLEFQDLQLRLINTHVTMNNLETTWQRLQTVATQNIVSRRQLWETENQLHIARSQFASLRRELQSVGLTPDQISEVVSRQTLVPTLPLRASIDGRVVGLYKRLGETIHAGEPVLEVHGSEEAWIRSFVNETQVHQIHLGQAARVRLVSQPELFWDATVVRRGQTVNPDSRALSVWLSLPKTDGQQVVHNMLVRTDFIVQGGSDVLAVPRESIVTESTRRYLFVQLPDDRFERRYVELGSADDRFVEVKTGLSVGEFVAVWGAAGLQSAFAAVR